MSFNAYHSGRTLVRTPLCAVVLPFFVAESTILRSKYVRKRVSEHAKFVENRREKGGLNLARYRNIMRVSDREKPWCPMIVLVPRVLRHLLLKKSQVVHWDVGPHRHTR